jgi:hypothetical protein
VPKAFPASLLTHIAQRSTSLNLLVRADREDGSSFGFTNHLETVSYGGLDYEPSDAVRASSIEEQIGSSVNNLDISGILSSARITEEDVRNGLWTGCRITIYLFDRDESPVDPAVMGSYFLGEVTIDPDGDFKAELRSLTQKLKTVIFDQASATCRARKLGDARCKLSLVGNSQSDFEILRPDGTGSPSEFDIFGGAASKHAAVDQDPSAPNKEVGIRADFGITSSTKTQEIELAAPSAWDSAGTGEIRVYLSRGSTGPIEATVRLREAGVERVSFTATLAVDGKLHSQTFAQSLITDASDLSIEIEASSVKLFGSNELDWIAAELKAVTNNAGSAIKSTKAIDSASSGSEMVFASAGAPSGFYDYGIVKFTTGQNAGLEREVKIHLLDSGKADLTLRTPFPYTPSVSDQAELTAGCDRRFSTCRDRFGNANNFHGEPYLPGNDKIGQIGRAPE